MPIRRNKIKELIIILVEIFNIFHIQFDFLGTNEKINQNRNKL